MNRRDFLWASCVFSALWGVFPFRKAFAQQKDKMAWPMSPSKGLSLGNSSLLPSWFDETRVCGHTRLTLKWGKENPQIFYGAANILWKNGFRQMVRHIKSGDEPCWWSRVGKFQTIRSDDNVTRNIIDSSHELGQKIICYYWHMSDAAVAESHPEWIARDRKGHPVNKRGYVLCLNSPYINILEQRIEELIRLGADGVYFDSFHMLRPLCTCNYCRKQFELETGRHYPDPLNYSNSDFLEAQKYQDLFLRRAFARLARRLKSVNPEAVMILGSSKYPGLVDSSTSHRLYSIADSVKTEFELTTRKSVNKIFLKNKSWREPQRDTRMSMGWAVSRDIAQGKPPHVWIPFLTTSQQAEFAVGGVVAYGGVANLDIDEKKIHSPIFNSAVFLGNKMAKGLAHKRPYRLVGLYLDEDARDRLQADQVNLWQDFLYPLYGTFETLVRRRIPVGFVTKSDLLSGNTKYVSILFLPNGNALADKEIAKEIDALKHRGCMVLTNSRYWNWHLGESQFDLASKSFVDSVSKNLDLYPLRINGGHARMHSNVYRSDDGTDWAIALCNDFSWVRGSRRKKSKQKPWSIGEFDPESLQKPDSCRNVSINIRGIKLLGSVNEIVSGNQIEATLINHGKGVELKLPDFNVAAVVTFTAAPLRP